MARSIGVQDATTQLRSPASKERLKAARELLRLADPLSASALADAVATETDPKVGGVLVAALRAVGGAESVRGVALGLERFDVGGFAAAAGAEWMGGHPDDPIALRSLISLIGHEAKTARQAAAVALSRFSAREAAEAVEAAFASGAIGRPTFTATLFMVTVGRTLEVFTDDAAVHGAFTAGLGTRPIVMAFRYHGANPGLSGGIVANREGLIFGARVARMRALLPKEVNEYREVRYADIDEYEVSPSGVAFRIGTEVVAYSGLDKLTGPQWVTAMAEVTPLIDATRSA